MSRLVEESTISMQRYVRDPWRDEMRGLRVHHVSPFERGSHASLRAYDYWVGKSASLGAPRIDLGKVLVKVLWAFHPQEQGAKVAGGLPILEIVDNHLHLPL